MLLKGFSRSLLSLALASTLGLISFSAGAASACKGLDESSCKQNQSCNWVSGYTTKNGNTVLAFCRNAGKKEKQGLNLKGETGTRSSANAGTAPGAGKAVRMLEEKSG
jgi:hypothetical protein